MSEWSSLERKVRDLLSTEISAPVFTGRGVVTCAGGKEYTINAYVMCRLLRYHGCDLPIEWFYMGDEIKPAWRAKILEIPNISLIDLNPTATGNKRKDMGGWQQKPMSIINSSFDEVLFLDADNMPYKDPTFLFDTPEFRDNTAIFWPDIADWKPDAFIGCLQDVFKVPYVPGRSFESGQLMIRKSQSWQALQLCNLYNQEHRDVYKVLYGDKDTFYFAWRRTDTPYHLIKTVPGFANGHALVQHDTRGEQQFCHLTQAKFFINGRGRMKPETFPYWRECYTFIREFNTE